MQTGGILQSHIRKASEKRGFVETRLLTHWREIVGAETAAMARPIKVAYGRKGFGATLTLLTNGANAPILQAESAKIRERVNACYGYAAISLIRITQTSETGFADAQTPYDPPSGPCPGQQRDPRDIARITSAVSGTVSGVKNDSLRSALEVLGQNILSHRQRKQT